MTKLHLISHTHWDREWYLPYQVYRTKLVDLVDNLLNILSIYNGYAHFMLDGQAIVLEDYLAVRPERELILHEFVAGGKISIGPWYILPDEFLVSPEAVIRNLLQGQRTCRRFGGRMMVGYIPDQFGHIAQMPQILAGFGILTACFQRGLSDEPCELVWEAPDGSRVLTSYLRDGYGNAAYLSLNQPGIFTRQILDLKDSLLTHSVSSNLLLMQGTDHTWAEPSTPAAVEAFNAGATNNLLVHSSLEAYFHDIQEELGLGIRKLPVVRGSLRDPKRSPLLPGVLSARMWIKQRSQQCQDLLEKWTEPFCVLAESTAASLGSPSPLISGGSSGLIREAWRLLLQCQPHDSICGCSIDQVHEEMKPRFDQIEQIGETLAVKALNFLSDQVNTTSNQNGSILVFNPHAFERTDRVTCRMTLPGNSPAWQAVSSDGDTSPMIINRMLPETGEMVTLDQRQWLQAAGRLENGEFSGERISSCELVTSGGVPLLILNLGSALPGPEAYQNMLRIRDNLLENPPESLSVRLLNPAAAEVEFLAQGVPGLGWRSYHLQPAEAAAASNPTGVLENEFFQVSPSTDHPGRLDILDKRSGFTYPGLHYFTSSGDKGDEYNFCPPEQDSIQVAEPVSFHFFRCSGKEELVIQSVIEAPAALAEDRSTRSNNRNLININSRIALAAGVDRVDIHTTVLNTCRDHRLRVHFPAPFRAAKAWSDGHFEVFQKSFKLPQFDHTWIEQPRPESYQRMFSTLEAPNASLTVANRGLPEVEMRQMENGDTELILTLLRCVGWLSRPDLSTRHGSAGPTLETPAAQMQGVWEFDYSIIPHTGSWQQSWQSAAAFNVPMRAVHTPTHLGPQKPAGQFFQITPPEFSITTLKTSEDETGLVLRGVNLTGQALQVKILPQLALGIPYEARLDESPGKKAFINPDGTITINAQKHGLATLIFKSGGF